jgi:predicted Rossmann-fold nucleotide-binding protein
MKLLAPRPVPVSSALKSSVASHVETPTQTTHDRFSATSTSPPAPASTLVSTANIPLSHVIPFYKAHPSRCGVVFYASATSQNDASLLKFVEAIGDGLKSARTPQAERFHVVCGGVGQPNSLMEAIARSASKGGVHTVGIDPSFNPPDRAYVAHKQARSKQFLKEFYPTTLAADTMHGRHSFDTRSAYTVALPGGTGTLMEIMTKATDLYFNSTLRPAQKQIILVNHNQFFTAPGGLMDHLKFFQRHGHLKPGFEKLFTLANTPQEVLDALQNPHVPWTPGQTPYRHLEPVLSARSASHRASRQSGAGSRVKSTYNT